MAGSVPCSLWYASCDAIAANGLKIRCSASIEALAYEVLFWSSSECFEVGAEVDVVFHPFAMQFDVLLGDFVRTPCTNAGVHQVHATTVSTIPLT